MARLIRPRGLVAGVDACREGWVAVALGVPARAREAGGLEVTLASDFASLLERLGPVKLIAVDIPIGLPEDGFRELDREARRMAGRRGLSATASDLSRYFARTFPAFVRG